MVSMGESRGADLVDKGKRRNAVAYVESRKVAVNHLPSCVVLAEHGKEGWVRVRPLP